jgi:hypothetical protein
MSESAAKTRAAPPATERVPAPAPVSAPRQQGASQAGPLQRAAPAMGLGVQREVAIGKPDDPFEREADKVADRISAGRDVEPDSISQVTPGALARTAATSPAAPPTAAAPPERKTPPVPVQKKGHGSGSGPEELRRAAKAVQREADGGGSSTSAMGAAASSAIAGKGSGKPLQDSTRRTLEAGLGTDLGHVRVHDDSAARASASALDARAFTHGSDIWLGPGASQDDTHLMAHEATHVVQQSTTAQRKIQRAGGQSGGGAAKNAKGGKTAAAKGPPGGGATIDHKARTISIPELNVPSYARKANAISAKVPVHLPKKPERPNDQRDVFAKGVMASSNYAANVMKNVDTGKGKGIRSATTGKMVYVLEPAQSGIHILGDADTLPERLALPRWDSDGKGGKGSVFDVDHLLEMQLGGQNIYGNMELLDSSANRSSGSRIHNEIVAKLGEALVPEIGKNLHWTKPPDLGEVQSQYDVSFATVNPSIQVAGEPDRYWGRGQMAAGDHVKPLKSLTARQIVAKGLVGDDTHLVMYPRVSGGTAHRLDWNTKTNKASGLPKGRGDFLYNVALSSVSYTPGSGGQITGIKYYGEDLLERTRFTWELKEMDGVPYTTYVDRTSVLKSVKLANLPGASPVEFGEVELGDNGGLMARGVLRPSLPLLKGLELDLTLENDELRLSKTFSGSELQFPGPIRVTTSSLTLSAGTDGLSVDGDVDFEVDRLGKGKIAGMGHFGGGRPAGFGIHGHFELDKKVFDGEARIEAGYEHGDFWGKGHLSIGPGKVRGIKSASLDASFGAGLFGAKGEIVPDIPAVEKVSLAVAYGEETGLMFAGDLSIKKDTPGLEGGSIHVEAMKAKGSDDFKVKASGSAKPRIPGINSELKVTYDDGMFDASITASYDKGRLKGSVLVGATNRPVADGAPSGPPPLHGDKITVYGGGSVTVVIAPWLQGTVGVRLLPNGEIELSGEIALPSSLDVFPEKKLEKTLLSIGIDIPIIGVAVAGHRIGVFATISGGLGVNAGIGPGQLEKLSLKVTYNPAHEEDTRVQGAASLHVPAHAGLRLFVRGAIGAGIPIVSAEAGLEIGATLGLEGALDTGVEVDWTPTKGLTLDANASIHVEPKFKVDVTGFVTVDADLLLTTINLYEHKWDLAGFEYGSGLRFGVAFPLHYQQGEPLDLSLDKVKFDVPDINPKEMLSDLMSRII